MGSLDDSGKGAFRINDWWWSKAALLMGMVYLLAAWYHIPLGKFVPLSVLSLITICGFASMGYLFNDLFDIEKDAAAGKANFLAGKPAWLIALLLLVSAGFVFGPWWWLPKNNFSFILIGAQILLFIIYSAPPVRLKERGIAGIAADALYAHGLPPVLAAYTFALAAQHPFSYSEIALLFSWQTIAGVRNILLHQADDLEADKLSGSKNFVAGLNVTTFEVLLRWLVFIELVLSVAFFGMLLTVNPLFGICIVTIIAFSVAVWMLYKERGMGLFADIPWRFYPNNVSEKWLPVAYLIILSAADFRFMALLVIHLAIFNFDFYYQVTKRIWLQIKASRAFFITIKIILSYPVNYTIYYTMRVFSIDLIKDQTSFLGYFRKRLGVKEASSKGIDE